MNIGVIYIRVYEEAEDFLMMNISGPREGDFITIKSYKHDGSLHRTWRDTMVLKTSDNAIIGCNDHTLVTEADGRRWVTREPALIYFHKHYWFNIVTMIRDNGVSYYCNLASPSVMDREALKYIDYDLDVKVFPNGEKRLLDVDEYEDSLMKLIPECGGDKNKFRDMASDFAKRQAEEILKGQEDVNVQEKGRQL